jgi:hypothetical protein
VSELGLSKETVELTAGGIKRALFIFPSVVDQRAAVLADHLTDKLLYGDLSQGRILIEIADDLSTENPSISCSHAFGWLSWQAQRLPDAAGKG